MKTTFCSCNNKLIKMMYRSLFVQFAYMMFKLDTGSDRWKERLKKEWKETCKFPRKKKKQRRKEIMIDWNIANSIPKFEKIPNIFNLNE